MQEFDPHVLEEKPIPPPEEFSKKARISSLDDYREMYAAAQADPEKFWGEQAKLLHWFEAPKKVLEWKPPHAKWFLGGKLNVSYNCLDRHLAKNANKPALMWEGEDGSTINTPTPNSTNASASLPTSCSRTAYSPPTALQFTCPWCRSCPSPCSHARAWAPCIPWFSAASAP